jgi:hypothetical protein
MSLIEQLFVAACRQLWGEYVGIPQHHLWALAVLRAAKHEEF